MATEQQSRIRLDEFVAKVLLGLKQAGEVLLVTGFRGVFSEPAHARIYLSARLDSYVDAKPEEIVYSEPLPEEQRPSGGVYFYVLVALAFLLAVTPPPIHAQLTTGVIEGMVYDQTGAVIADASVRFASSATGSVRIAPTDGAGRFCAFLLPPGRYIAEVDKQGFLTSIQQDVVLAVGQTLRLEFTLKAAGKKEVVTVTNDNPISSVDPEQSTLLTNQAVNNLPSSRRDFADFINLTPTASLLESRYGSTLTIDGQKGIYSSISIDGSDDNNPFYGERSGGELPEFTISLAGVKEFQVVEQGASAEYGRSTGAFVNVVTQSGTNQFHGSGLLFFRDPALASDNPLATKAQEQSDNPRQYQFGANFGGPIKRDRVFFFLSYDQNGGDIAKSNRIDPTLVNIFATQFNDPNEQGTIDRTNSANAALGRIDWMINSTNTLTLRHTYASADLKNGDFDVPTWGRSCNGREHDLNNATIAQLVTGFSPNLFNELRVQYSRENRDRLYQGPDLADVTIAGTDPVTGQPTAFRFGRPFFLPGSALDTRYDVTENVSINHGSHLVNTGFEFNDTYTLNPFLGQGRYIFSSIQGFQAYLNNPTDLSGLLLFSQNVPLGGRTLAQAGTQSFAQVEPEAYVQDHWRPLRNLSIGYGIRYAAELEPQPVTPLPLRRYAQFIGQPGFPSNGSIPSPKEEWQPRLGIAWTPSADSRTILRGNIGIYYARTTGLLLFAARTYDGTIQGTISSCCGKEPTPPPNLGFLSDTQSFNIPNPGVYVYSKNFQNPRSLQWSESVQREVLKNLFFSFGFNYDHTIHIARLVNANTPEFIGHYAADGRKLFDGPMPFAKADGSGIGELGTEESTASSLYRAFTFVLERRFNHRAGFQVNYTLSWDKSDDDTEQDPFLLEYADVTNFKPEYSYSDRDQRSRLNALASFDLPYEIVFTTTFQSRSPSPYTIFLNYDANEDGNLYDRPYVNGHDIGRNTARLNNQFYSWNISLQRQFALSERVRLEGIASVFNLVNNPNLRGLSDSLLFNFDGFIRSGFGTPREAQLGLKVQF